MNQIQCSSCHGSGKCPFCNGLGKRNQLKPRIQGKIPHELAIPPSNDLYPPKPPPFPHSSNSPCQMCHGTGKCQMCLGTGMNIVK